MNQLITSYDHLAIDRLVSVAGATLWVYDYLLTCVDEYATIWSTNWSLVKGLYLINRYIAVPYIGLAMFYMLGEPEQRNGKTFCRIYTIATFIMREFELVAATWLVMIRVRSLYARHRWATWVLYTTFAITHLLTAGFGAQSIVETYNTLAYLSFLRVCLSGVPTYTKLLYFFQIPFEFLLLTMQLVHYWRLSRSITPIRPTPLLTALYTDGVLYFIATITVRLWAGFTVVFADPTFWYMTVVIDLATTSTFISRIFLHLAKVSSRSRYGDESTFPSLQTTASFHVGQRTAPAPADTWMEMERSRADH